MIPTGLPCPEATPAGRPEFQRRTWGLTLSQQPFKRTLPEVLRRATTWSSTARPQRQAAEKRPWLRRSRVRPSEALGLGFFGRFRAPEAWWHRSMASRSLPGWCGPRHLRWPEVLVRASCLVITALFPVPHGSHQPGAFCNCGRQSLVHSALR